MQKIKIRCVTFILVFLAVINTIFFTEGQKSFEVKAEGIIYTNVLEDLRKDTSFDPGNYPARADDYSLKIIQLAETVNKELFVYVYQPSGSKVKASSVNLSTEANDKISYRNYKLVLTSESGTLFKYKVQNFSVKSESARYYAISSVYRLFDENIDDNKSGDNTINEVNYTVNKQYCFSEINGKPYISCVDIETIVVTDKFVGFVRYPDGFKLYVGACDSHFVAFETNKPIDKLLEADVYYTTQEYSSSWVALSGTSETFGKKEDEYAYLRYTDKVEHTGGGWFAGTYKWDRIQSIDDFIANENKDNIYHGAVIDVTHSTKLTDVALAELKGKKWVLRFAETDYSMWTGQSSYGTFATLVGDVTILRLKFETDGITYNLGVIDNKQTGGKNPSNETEIDVNLNDRSKTILQLLLLVLLLILLAPLLPYIIYFIVWIITFPIKGIVSLIRSIKRRRIEKRVRKEFADRRKANEK